MNNLKNDLDNSLTSILIKYDMYYTNYQYKNKHFKNIEQYEFVQKSLANEIENEERNIKNILILIFNDLYPEYKIIAYDSRKIHSSNKIKRIGNLLISGLPTDSSNIVLNINKKLTDDYDIEVTLDRYEDLPDELKKKFTI